jgi:hypothetical protein
MVQPIKKGGLGMWGFNLETNRLSKDLKDLLNSFVSREYCLPADNRAAPISTLVLYQESGPSNMWDH